MAGQGRSDEKSVLVGELAPGGTAILRGQVLYKGHEEAARQKIWRCVQIFGQAGKALSVGGNAFVPAFLRLIF
jgi:hypothetical protein